jgi:TolB-like protein/Tfp pilus assembly protein PilF
MKILQELKRRNVFKVGIVYAVTTWILLQLTDVVSEILGLPEWAPKLILLILVVGFVPALIIAWAFELTPEGIKLEKDVVREESIAPRTGRRMDYIIIVLLGLSLGYFIWESRFEQKAEEIEQAVASGANEVAAIEPPASVITEADEEAQVIDENSIAVLPFANRSDDKGDMYFTDGIHDDLLTQLSKIDAFSVISRTSVMEYRDTTKNLKEIAKELSVANVMEGSVQRAGDRVRINVQLIDAETDEHLWAEIYDRELTTNNLFDIQSEIAKNIASALEATLTESELASVTEVPTDSVAAYDLYLQARRFALGETRIGYQTALELFEEALLLDPEFKHAWLGVARAHITNYWVYGGDPADRQKARDSIDRAKAIDPNFAELYMAEGFYWYWGYLDYERALYNLEKAIDMMPGSYEAHMWHGWASRRSGLWEQAITSMQQALKFNPRVSFNWVEYGGTLMFLHRYAEARDAIETAREMDPDNFWGKTNLALLNIIELGDIQSAIRLTAGAQHTPESNFFSLFIVARLYADRFDEALEAARDMQKDLEIQLQSIRMKEDWEARILHFAGRHDEATSAADAALFRLRNLRNQGTEDYRVYLAEAMLAAIKGENEGAIRARVQKAVDSQPDDAVENFRFQLEYARIFAVAGMVEESIELLEPLFSPPGETSAFTVELDPAFDRIREAPDFVAMMERHR